jgi:hypothetical protein
MITAENRKQLIAALEDLATTIERSPPPIVGSEINVYAASGSGSVIGQTTSVTAAGPGAGSVYGERISAIATRPGQSVTGKIINVVAGGPPPDQSQFQGPQSAAEVDDMIHQLRDAAKALETSDAPKSWIAGILPQVERWGWAALSGAISGATNALTRAYLGA